MVTAIWRLLASFQVKYLSCLEMVLARLVRRRVNVGSEPSSIVAQDFNNDGKPDLAIALIVNMAVLINNGDGTFGAPTILYVGWQQPGNDSYSRFQQ